MTDDDEPLVKPEQAALFLGVAVMTMADWRGTGKGPPFVKMTDAHNSPVRYRMSELRKFVEERTYQRTAEYDTRPASQRVA